MSSQPLQQVPKIQAPWQLPMFSFGVLPASDGQLGKAATENQTVGVDGDFLIESLLHKCHEQGDRYWMFDDAFPITILKLLDGVTDTLAKHFQRVVIVFDGVPTKHVNRAACMAPMLLQNPSWRGIMDPRLLLSKQPTDQAEPAVRETLARCTELAFPDPQGLAYLRRYLAVKKKVEVFVAPSLAWAQLAAFRAPTKSPEIDVVIAPIEALFFEPLDHVVCNFHDSQPNALATKFLAFNRADSDLSSVTQLAIGNGRPRWMRRVGFLQGQYPLHYPLLLDTPVFDMSDLTVKPLSRVTSGKPPAPSYPPLRELFTGHLGADEGKTYLAMALGAIDPTCLAVMASGVFQDSQTVLPTADYEAMMQRIMPLRAQIIYQLVQARFPNAPTWELSWDRAAAMAVTPLGLPQPPPPNPRVPICKPPEITLDKWSLPPHLVDTPGRRSTAVAPLNAGVAYGYASAPNPPMHTLTSVVHEFSQEACAPQQCAPYDSASKLLAATLLKSLDLLGYFTHSAGSTTQELSTGSIYATALGAMASFPEEGVLFIELCRTRTLNDQAPQLRDLSGMPSIDTPSIGPSVLLALRVLSLLNVPLAESASQGYQGVVNPFLMAYVAQVRAFQQNLRHLVEVILHNLIVADGRIDYSQVHPRKLRDVALQLPFGRPVTCNAANIAIAILHFGVATRRPHPAAFIQHLTTMVPNVDIPAALRSMQAFWFAAMQAVEVLNSETEVAVFQSMPQANNLMQTIFKELLG